MRKENVPKKEAHDRKVIARMASGLSSLKAQDAETGSETRTLRVPAVILTTQFLESQYLAACRAAERF